MRGRESTAAAESPARDTGEERVRIHGAFP